MCYLKTSCICRYLDVHIRLLDPRNIAASDEISLRPFYSSWEQRKQDRVFKSTEYYRSKSHDVISFDEDTQQRHKCHFENLELIFDYQNFNEPRNPSVCAASSRTKRILTFPLMIILHKRKICLLYFLWRICRTTNSEFRSNTIIYVNLFREWSMRIIQWQEVFISTTLD